MRLSWIRAPLLVGILVVAGIAGLVYMVSKLKTTVMSGPDTYVVFAVFDDVTGLVENSSVNVVGIPVGAIDSIERVETDEGVRARVGVRLRNDVRLYAGQENREGRVVGAASVMRKQSSILGDFYLSISPGAFGPELEEGDYVPNVIAKSGVEEVFEQVNRFGDLYPKLDKITTNVVSITANLAQTLDKMKKTTYVEDIAGNVRDMSLEARDISQKLNRVSGEVERVVLGGAVGRVATAVESSAANIQKATGTAIQIVDKIERIVSAGDVERVVSNLTETSRQLSSVGLQLSDVIDEGIAPRISQLNRIFKNFERFSQNLADFTGAETKDLHQTLANFKLFSERLLDLTAEGKGQIKTTMGTVRNTLDKAVASLGRLDDILDNVNAITKDVREGRGTVGRLLTDDRLVEEVEEILSDTKDFVKSYTLMETEVQLASSYFLDSRSNKNVLSIKFRPGEDKYYLLQIVDDPRGYTTDEFVVTETNDPSLPPVVKERVERTTHALKLSFQFAKRFYFVTGRFGIMENTGGLGLDLDFFDDRLSFQFDLFDFTLNSNPRLRGAVEWEVFRHVIVSGGVDDVLNEAYRDYFITAGIRFTDEDLKALLLAAPPISP